MLNPILRTFIVLAFVALGTTPVFALNPQPEVPSKQSPGGNSRPKALNPQPEVPSKQNADAHGSPKALNPQPEVPSKPKKKKQNSTKSKPLK